MAEEKDLDKDRDKTTKRPASPRHPGDDAAMPPYAPGGVPEPAGDAQEPAGEIKEREVPPSGFPPKRAP
jgi:hypothetical protein